MAKARQQQSEQTKESRVGDATLSPKLASHTVPALHLPKRVFPFLTMFVLPHQVH